MMLIAPPDGVGLPIVMAPPTDAPTPPAEPFAVVAAPPAPPLMVTAEAFITRRPVPVSTASPPATVPPCPPVNVTEPPLTENVAFPPPVLIIAVVDAVPAIPVTERLPLPVLDAVK